MKVVVSLMKRQDKVISIMGNYKIPLQGKEGIIVVPVCMLTLLTVEAEVTLQEDLLPYIQTLTCYVRRVVVMMAKID